MGNVDEWRKNNAIYLSTMKQFEMVITSTMLMMCGEDRPGMYLCPICRALEEYVVRGCMIFFN